jgi:hypothetical protein
VLVGVVNLRLIKDDQAVVTLIQNTAQLLIKNHLRQLALNQSGWEFDELGGVIDLNLGERLNDTEQVLLKQGIIKSAQVAVDQSVILQLVLVRLDRALELLQAAVRVSRGNGTHGLQLRSGETKGELSINEGLYILSNVGHDLTEQHPLEALNGAGITECVQILKRFIEVTVGGFVVLLVAMEGGGLHVEVGLQQGRAVDSVGICSSSSKCGLNTKKSKNTSSGGTRENKRPRAVDLGDRGRTLALGKWLRA